MKNYARPEIAITGVGVLSAVGQGRAKFTTALMNGEHAFAVMSRPGRQNKSQFLGAELADLSFPADIPTASVRTASFSAQVALLALHEAWHDAQLSGVDSERIGLVVGGSNFQQRDLVRTYDAYAGRAQFLRPTYGMSYMDTDMCGLCTAQFGIRGFAYTIGGASASGQLAIIRAAQAVAAGEVDACIALGALSDLSYWECQGLRSLGAMGSDRYAQEPASACRPFDRDRDGFIYGECCGAVVVEKLSTTTRLVTPPHGLVSGWSVVTDGNRNPNPSLEGEVHAIEKALRHARWSPKDVDYLNPHGSGSAIGDETEVAAIHRSGLSHVLLNATKSITGHGLSAAGAVEAIATLIQMQALRLHPTRNLEHPMDPALNWVGVRPMEHTIERALSLSLGFGGINTALCLQRCR